MKKLTLLVGLIVSLTGCAVYQSLNETIAIDYSRYHAKGFFITESNSVSFDYEPVGSVLTLLKGTELIEVKREKQRDPNIKHSAREGRERSYYTEGKEYSVYQAIDRFCNKCTSMGANGVINFSVTFTYDDTFGNGYEVSGMAIKR